VTAKACPFANQHTNGPAGYLEWHEWAAEMGKTHRCIACKGCGMFKVWVPRRTVASTRTGPLQEEDR
jgi:hypothetical protein